MTPAVRKITFASSLALMTAIGVACWPPSTTSVASAAPVPPPAGLDSAVRPFLNAHCVSCHGGSEPDAGLSLETLPATFSRGR